MKISIFGSGYVGLVTAACLAEVGHEVKCFDILKDRISSLQKNKVPIFEPGLAEIIKKNSSERRLSFTSEINDVLNNPELIFIAVGTPQNEEGSTDLSSIKAVATSIGQNLLKDTVICVKSTVPVGTTDMVNEIINSCLSDRKLSIKTDICFNPDINQTKHVQQTVTFTFPPGGSCHKLQATGDPISNLGTRCPLLLGGQGNVDSKLAQSFCTKH